MASTSCLGLFIDNHIIKYAKVSKDNKNIKVESFGVKFYDKLNEAIEQVIQETYSQKTPISVNLSEEVYNYFDMFALLNKKDLEKAIKTEFDAYCAEQGYNPNVLESRYAIVERPDDRDKIKVIHVSENKIELNKIISQIDGYKLINISPIPMSIPNLVDTEKEEDCLIVNIEDKTTITTFLQNKVYQVEKLDIGCEEFLSKINLRENSYSKAYEICKNTTIYTSEGINLQEDYSEYLEEIMPVLQNIISEIRKAINASDRKINKVYITGTAALINNIDLYFQEYLGKIDCEILKPYFVRETRDISVKDYIEVNSAISLGLTGLGEGILGMNFKKQSFQDKIPDWLKIEVNPDRTPNEKKKLGGMLTWDLGQQLDNTERGLLRTIIGLFLLVIIYSTFSTLLGIQIKNKQKEAEDSIATTNSQIALANSDDEKVKTRTNSYTNMIKNLEEANNKILDRNKTRNVIPNLLNQMMSIVPNSVQLTSIENTSGTHIVISAQSDKYEQLGYLKAKIKNDVILTNVISTAGQKDGGVVTVKIEGDIP